MNHLLALLALCGTVTVTAANAKTVTKTQEAMESARQITNALDMFFVDCDEFPSSLDGLLKPSESCNGMWGPDPYLLNIPADPWAHKWHYYRINQSHFMLKSYGADGKEGGEGANSDLVVEVTAPREEKQ